MTLEEKAYCLARRWRRNEITGDQFDYHLSSMNISEEYCLQVASERDKRYLEQMVKELAVIFLFLLTIYQWVKRC